MDGDTGERWGEDPGWRVLRRARGDRLMTLRRVYLSFAVGLVVLADQARLLLPFRDSTAADIWALAIGAIAFATYVTAQAARHETRVQERVSLVVHDLKTPLSSIHTASRINQSRRHDGQAAAFFDVAGGAEESLGPLEGV